MSKRHRSHTASCCRTGKASYRDRIAADLALERIQLRARRTIHDETRSYSCNLCAGWHLTSQAKYALDPRIAHSA